QLLQESAGKLPDSPEIQLHLGTAHYMLGEEDPARTALQKAAQSAKDFPDKDDARRRLAVLQIDPPTANPAARTELDNYLRERPNDPMALFRLAQLQERDGAPDKAAGTYEKILSGYPQFGPALRQLALLSGQRSADDPKTPDSPKLFDTVSKARLAYPDDA